MHSYNNWTQGPKKKNICWTLCPRGNSWTLGPRRTSWTQGPVGRIGQSVREVTVGH